MMPRRLPEVRKARSLLFDTEPAPRRGFLEAKTEVDPPADLPREVTRLATARGTFPLDALLRSGEIAVDSTRVARVRADDVAEKTIVEPEPAAPAPARAPVPARDKSVVRRMLDSVVTALPQALVALVAPPEVAAPKPVTDETWRELRTLPFLDGVPNAALSEALAAGDLALVRYGRDDLVDTDGRALLVGAGQLALARFDEKKLAAERAAQAARKPGDKKAEKKEQKRRQEVGPLIRVAERNLAFFEEGDLVDIAPDGKPYACYAVTPAKAISIARGRLGAWRGQFPFLADRLRRASQAARQRIDAVVGAREEVADFFLRHGLSVAQTLRVRQIDKCVECGACEAACEERYGAKRLTLNGHVLGGLDFVSACHTCSDQRCIDPCAFDAIKYDEERREVVIVEASCTGCTLCATACPYQAIEMHDLEDKPLLALRLGRAGALAFGEGTPRKAKLKRMASKCDHCVSYADQACISACPTGALFEVAPADVFHARPEAVRDAARAGFDHSVAIDLNNVHDPRVFQRGIDDQRLKRIDRARAVRPRIWTTWMWVVGLASWLACVAEIVLRKVAPERSFDYLYQTLVDGIEPSIAVTRVDYRPGCELAVRLGTIGTIIMFSGMLYPARRRIARLRNLGSQRAWFDMHVLTGVIGPLFIVLHTVAKLDNWVSLAFWSMVGTVLSGLVGRYLTTQLPERASSAALDALEVDRKLAALRARHATVRAADDWFAAYQRRVGEVAKRPLVAILGWLVADDFARATRHRALGEALGGVPDPRARREAARCASRLALYERRRVLLPRLEPLFRRWKLVHVPMAIALTVIGGVHIAISLLRG